MYTIYDRTDCRTYTAEDRYELEEKLNEIFDVEQEGIADAIDHLCRHIGYGYVGDDEDVLNIEVEVA